MAITVLPRRGNIGGNIGAALGTGLGGILEGLAEGKVQQMQRQQGTQALQGLNISPEKAQGIAQLMQINPQLAQQALKQVLQEPSQQAYAQAIGGMLGGQPEGGGVPGQVDTGESFQPGAAGLTERQTTELAKMGMQKQKQQIARQKSIQQANDPFMKEVRETARPAKKINTLIKRALDTLEKVTATGPLGLLPATSEEAQDLDSVLGELLVQKATMEGKGQRGTKMYLELQKAAKPHRGLFKKTLQKRLGDLQSEATKELRKSNITDQVIADNQGMQPAGLETTVKNIIKVSKRLPSTSKYSEGATGSEGGFTFRREGNKWVYAGKVPGGR